MGYLGMRPLEDASWSDSLRFPNYRLRNGVPKHSHTRVGAGPTSSLTAWHGTICDRLASVTGRHGPALTELHGPALTGLCGPALTLVHPNAVRSCQTSLRNQVSVPRSAYCCCLGLPHQPILHAGCISTPAPLPPPQGACMQGPADGGPLSDKTPKGLGVSVGARPLSSFRAGPFSSLRAEWLCLDRAAGPCPD